MVRVSVIIPAFNVERCVERAIKSIQNQTIQDVEILVVDDASTDNTVSLVQAFAGQDNRIRLFVLEKNSGPSVARNKGIRESTGTWIAVLDADDAFEPNRLETLLLRAEGARCDLVADNMLDCDLVFGEGQTKTDFTQGRQQILISKEESFPISPEIFGAKILSRLKILARRAFLSEHNLCYAENIRFGEDFLLYAESLALGARLLIVRDALYLFTIPYSLKSFKKSPFTRTVVDPLQLVQGIDALCLKYKGHIPGDLMRMLQARKRNCTDNAKYAAIKKGILQDHKLSFIWTLASSPRLWSRFGGNLLHSVRRRLAL